MHSLALLAQPPVHQAQDQQGHQAAAVMQAMAAQQAQAEADLLDKEATAALD